MPSYDYCCDTCKIKAEKIHRMSEDPSYPCPKCGEPMKRMFSPNISGFILKGGTPTMHWKEKRQRMKKREELGVRQEKYRSSMPKARPNIAGVEVDSWSDAKKMAKEAGLDHESYTPWVDKEKKGIVVPSGGIGDSAKGT